ncbi:hypothetical protein [Plantactinospora veratri]
MPVLRDAVELQVRPDYNMFGFGDTAVIEDLIPTLPIETGNWISVTAAALLIESPQRRHPVTLRLESFDAVPADDTTGWEVTETVVLHLPTGRISVNAMSSGHIRDVLRLPRPGDYRLRIKGRNRQETAEADRRLYETLDIDDPAFETERQRLAGRESYLGQFWPA